MKHNGTGKKLFKNISLCELDKEQDIKKQIGFRENDKNLFTEDFKSNNKDIEIFNQFDGKDKATNENGMVVDKETKTKLEALETKAIEIKDSITV